MTPMLSTLEHECPYLEKDGELADTAIDSPEDDTLSTIVSQEDKVWVDSDSETNESECDYSDGSSEEDGSCDGNDESSSMDDDDHAYLEAELMRFTLDRAASCSRLGGGFPSLDRERKIAAAPMLRRTSSASKINMKELLVSAGLQEDDGVRPECSDEESLSSSDGDSETESESEGLDEQMELLQASVNSLYNMKGLVKPAKAVAPNLDGELGLIDIDDEEMERFTKRDATSMHLTIIQTDSHQTTKTSKTEDIPKPAKVLRSILGHGTRDSYPFEMWEGYFLEVQNHHIRANTKEMELMVRCEDFGRLRAIIRSGKSLQSCNQHGESVVHLACRRSSVKLLKFLMKEAQVTVRVRDDYGRSPLHDACWSYNDRFDIFKTILQDSPELLFVQDKRGFSPFDYIPKERWVHWNEFLKANTKFLREAVKGVDLADMDACVQSKQEIKID